MADGARVGRIKAARIRKALDSAEMLGFRNTRLMLEGLGEQLYDFENRSIQSAPGKAQRILSKVHLIRQSMENEMSLANKKEIRREAGFSLCSRILNCAIVNLGSGAFLFMLPELSQMQNLQMALIVKISAISFFGLKVAREIRETVREAGDYTVEGMKRNIEGLCRFAAEHVEKAMDDIRGLMSERLRVSQDSK